MELVQFRKNNIFGNVCVILFFVMGQWFRISFCLKIYYVLVLVAGYTVQQSISVCSISVSREF